MLREGGYVVLLTINIVEVLMKPETYGALINVWTILRVVSKF